MLLAVAVISIAVIIIAVYKTGIVSCPDPPHVQRGSKQHCLSQGVGMILGLRSPISSEKTYLYLHDLTLNRIGNLSRSLFSAVTINLAAIWSFCKWGCVVVRMHPGIRNSSARF